MSEQTNYALEIEDLFVEYHVDKEVVHALNGISLKMKKGETIGLVGETGAGKTTTGLSILRLIPSPPGVVKGKILVKGEDVTLTYKEFTLLCLLCENRGLVLTRSVLMDRVWGLESEPENRTLDVHIRTLRSKLGEAGSLIETVRGIGYRMRGEDRT